jgi:hypothetical protein
VISAIPAEVQLAAAVVTAVLVAVVALGIWCGWRRNWRGLFAVLWLGTATAVVSAVVLAMPYANQRLRLQTDGPRLDELGIRDGQLASWGFVPDFFRYYTSADVRLLRDDREARDFFSSSDSVLCLVRAKDLATLEGATGASLHTWARYVAQDRTYLLVSQRPQPTTAR